METMYQITHNGLSFCEPVGLAQKNAIAKALEGVTNVEITPVVRAPVLKIIEGGRK